MKNIYLYLSSLCFVLFAGLSFTSCDDTNSEDGAGDGALGIKVYSPTKVIPGQEVIITGTGFDAVDAVVFPGDISVTNFVQVAPHMISVKTPVGIDKDGGSLSLKAGNETVIAHIPMTHGNPKIQTLMPADTIMMKKELKIFGTDLEFIKKVIIPGGEFENESGEMESVEDMVVEAIDFTCLSTSEIRLIVPDGSFQGTTPLQLVGVDETVRLTTEIEVIPPVTGEWVIVEKELWKGSFDLGTWSNNWEVPCDIFAEAELEVGSVVTLHFETSSDSWQFKINDGNWGADYGYLGGGYTVKPENNESNTSFDIIVDETILGWLDGSRVAAAGWGFAIIINGENVIFNRITTNVSEWVEIGDEPKEVVAWEGSFDLGTWSNNWEVSCDIFAEIELKVGSVVTLHYETYADFWQFKINDGNWGADYGYLGGGYTVTPENHESNTSFEIVVDNTILGWLDGSRVAASGWGSAIIINGENLIFKKITCLP